MGEVIAVGPGIYSVTGTWLETQVKVGEVVVFPYLRPVLEYLNDKRERVRNREGRLERVDKGLPGGHPRFGRVRRKRRGHNYAFRVISIGFALATSFLANSIPTASASSFPFLRKATSKPLTK